MVADPGAVISGLESDLALAIVEGKTPPALAIARVIFDRPETPAADVAFAFGLVVSGVDIPVVNRAGRKAALVARAYRTHLALISDIYAAGQVQNGAVDCDGLWRYWLDTDEAFFPVRLFRRTSRR